MMARLPYLVVGLMACLLAASALIGWPDRGWAEEAKESRATAGDRSADAASSRDKTPVDAGALRPLWTTSRVIGSPEPPRPYTVEPIFTTQAWKAPIYAITEPAAHQLLVILQGGEAERPSRVVRLPDDPQTQVEPTLFLELSRRLIYGLVFHPDYANNRFVYVFSNGPTGEPERVNRISRFTVRADEPRDCDSSSELVVLEWRSMGHDGGDLVFGHDGMLYITSGDGTSDSDGWVTGQDLRDLAGGVLRIDVDRPAPNLNYSVPEDNPFVKLPGARPEMWAYGLRNPWRMTMDPKTGQIWVGNNGQDLWETAHLLRRGENYGWSVFEGSHPFHAQGPIGPTPPVPPTLEHSHAEARSLTGGVVYYGDSLVSLQGVYVYGDYSTGKIWGAKHDGQQVIWHQELADTSLQIAGFARTDRGDLIVVDHAGGLFRLVPTPPAESLPDFPDKLSETGLFQSVADYRVAEGVIPYEVNAPGWHDGASTDHHLAIPGDGIIQYTNDRAWTLPEGTVLMQTLFFGKEPGWLDDPPTRPQVRRIETRLLTRQQGEWNGYSYRWNDEQTDATLVAAGGEDMLLALPDGRGHPWHVPSRTECMNCHSRAVGYLLSMTAVQQNRLRGDSKGPDAAEAHRPYHWESLGLFGSEKPDVTHKRGPVRPLVNPYDETQSLEQRVRSYLHTNCSGCHVEAGGGNARMELEWIRDLDEMRVVDVRPLHDTFGINNAMLVAAGDPDRSVLVHRISRRGTGQMPPLVTQHVDDAAVKMVREWIATLPSPYPVVQHWRLQDLQDQLVDESHQATDDQRSSGRKSFDRLGCAQCHRFEEKGGGAGPNLDDVASRLTPFELLEAIVDPSKKVAPEFATTVFELTDGRVVEGRILEETTDHVLIQTSSSFTPPIKITLDQIEHRTLSGNSLMPVGTLDTLTADQVSDLIIFLKSAARPTPK